jgi:hypothetical protein
MLYKLCRRSKYIPIRKKPNCFFDVMYDGMRTKLGLGKIVAKDS